MTVSTCKIPLWRPGRPKSDSQIRLIPVSLVILSLLACSTTVWGESTTAQQARAAVQHWMTADKANTATKAQVARACPRIDRVTTVCDGDDQPLYHIVQLDPEGFVITSADDEIEPVIAFSDTGSFDPAEKNMLTALLDRDMKGRLGSLRSKSQKGFHQKLLVQNRNAKAKEKWDGLLYGAAEYAGTTAVNGLPSIPDMRVAPLVETRWSDRWCCATPTLVISCANYYTPHDANEPDEPGNWYNYGAGCVGMGVAQVMYYHQHPTGAITNSSDYQVWINKTETRRKLRGGDGERGPYQWHLMPLEPDCNATETQVQAIGALCFDASVACHTHYSRGVSTADAADVGQAFLESFDYANTMLAYDGGKDITNHLADMINANLDAAYPVIIGLAHTTEPNVGHVAVCDAYGYEGTTPYHRIKMASPLSAEVLVAPDLWYNLPYVADRDGFSGFDLFRFCAYNIFPHGTGEIISGRVTDNDGLPVEGAVIRATRDNGELYTATTNDKGVYALARIPSDSDYFIKATKFGYRFADQRVSTGTSEDLTVECGNRWGVDFVHGSMAGAIECWGGGYLLQYADVPLPTDSDFVAVSASATNALGLKANGSLVHWGDDTGTGVSNIPAPNSGFAQMACGYLYNVALRTDGTLVAWGLDIVGSRNPPAGNNYVAVSTYGGATHGIALTSGGSIVSWGQNNFEQRAVPPGSDFVAISAGLSHNVGLRADGSIAAAGDTRGDGIILEVPPGNDYVAIAAGAQFTVALKGDGSLAAAGYNLRTNCDVPGGNDYIAIAAGHYQGLALKSDGTLVTWGWNSDVSPDDLPTTGGYELIAMGPKNALAIKPAVSGDITGDGKVDANDFSSLGAQWGRSGCASDRCGGADLTGDGAVNHADLAVMALRWLHNTN